MPQVWTTANKKAGRMPYGKRFYHIQPVSRLLQPFGGDFNAIISRATPAESTAC
jgi:hypothetical protein